MTQQIGSRGSRKLGRGALRALTVAGGLALTACFGFGTDSKPPPKDAPADTPRRVLPPGATAPLFNDLGDTHRPITTSSPLAQRYFDQGLILTYAFNHEEALRSFREALRLDPDCALCYWGEAYALGPNINKPMDPADAPRAWEAMQEALRAAAGATAVERALVRALAKRYRPEAPSDRAPLDLAYADAMREVAREFPEDLDVQALFAESLMDTMPWDYYQADGAPKPATVEVLQTLERVLRADPYHPGAIHFYIHAVEPSDHPELAEAPADRLRGLVPGAGHLVHMPSHVYLRVGRYHDASVVNEEAARADESYISQCRAQGFYPVSYYPHNIDFLQASSAFEGRSKVSIEAARKLREVIPPEAVKQEPLVEEFFPRPLYALARFGKWEEILAEPRPPEELRYLTGAWHYSRGLAYAATGRLPQAEQELAAVREAQASYADSDFTFWSGASPRMLLGIATRVLEARIAGARGRWEDALAPLREAVTMQDALPYTEPPPWYFPVREALGHALLEAGRAEEAEAVYREQLEYTPRNGWSLFGLAESLRVQGRDAEAEQVERRFREAWQLADVELEASVF